MAVATAEQDEVHSILASALDAIGLDIAYVFASLGLREGNKTTLDGNSLSVHEWFAICRALYIDPGFMSYGYDRRIHRHRIAEAWRTGQLWLPRTREVRELLREAKRIERRNRRWCDNHYGFRLRWRTRVKDLKKDLLRLPRRLRNEFLMHKLSTTVLGSSPITPRRGGDFAVVAGPGRVLGAELSS